MYAKESVSKSYSPLSYYLVKVFVEIPSLIASTLVYSCGGYWLMGFSYNFEQFLMFCKNYYNLGLVMGTLALMGSSLGMFAGMLVLDQNKLSIVMPITFVPLMLFSGIFNKLNNITILLRWLQYISPYRYGVHMLLLN